MKLDDLRLFELLEGADDGGVLTFAGQRTLLFDAVALGLLRKQLVDLFGPVAARGILTRFGYAHGWRTAENLRDALPWDDLRDWKRAGGVLHRLQGLVDYRPTPRTDPRNRAEARWLQSYEAQQHRLHIGPSDEVVCWTLTGFASGYMSRAHDHPIYCIETKCQGRGDAVCHMIGRTREDWGEQIEDIEPYYAEHAVDAALGIVRERLLRDQVQWVARRRQQDLAVDGVGHEVVARSEAMRRALELALRIAIVDTTVLITGESGTGKECLARTIHEHSQRANGPFLAVNCGALPENLLDSELFGHKKGSFTGAEVDRPGLFEAAAGGTLFLDEIGELTPATQVRLLRVLQEREVRRVGENRARPVDVRVVCATHRDLRREIAAGRFREDLYYRLRVVEIEVAPLRERAADVIPLAELFLEQARERLKRPKVRGFTSEALRAMAAHRWPGNVRELENAVERAVALARGVYVEMDDLPADLGGTAPSLARPDAVASSADAVSTLAEVERAHILRTLADADGVRTEAARRLGISAATLYRKLAAYGVGTRTRSR